jgi:hypothetical protein
VDLKGTFGNVKKHEISILGGKTWVLEAIGVATINVCKSNCASFKFQMSALG